MRLESKKVAVPRLCFEREEQIHQLALRDSTL
jgi:hypothetical protein